jgi:transmembrane sensor
LSDTASSQAAASSVAARAAAWLERREAKGWSAEDHRALEAWLEEAEENCAAFWRLEAAWNQAQRLAALHTVSDMRGSAQRSNFWSIFIRSVATIAFFVALGIGTKYVLPLSRGEQYTTPVGGREVLTLADGSQVELNTDTAIRVDLQSAKRTVTLIRGEAFFQVQHDVARPFVVIAGEQRITDLGTKFLVRERDDGVEVALLEGRAHVEGTNASVHPQSAILTPGDVVMATSSTMVLMKKSDVQLRNAAAWRKGVLVFDHTTLAAAADEFNRYNQTKLIIADSRAGRRILGGTFPTNDIADFTRLVAAVLDLRVERRGGQILISR